MSILDYVVKGNLHGERKTEGNETGIEVRGPGVNSPKVSD